MGNIGITELFVLVAIPLFGAFAVGFFIGKGVGFKQGIREPRR